MKELAAFIFFCTGFALIALGTNLLTAVGVAALYTSFRLYD